MKTICRAVLIVLVAAACAKAPAGAGTEHPSGADQLVLRVQHTGGLINPAVTADQVPEFSLLGDGSVFTPGAAPAIYPGPAIEEPLVTRLSDGGVQAILAAAREAGLFANNTSNGPGIPDTGTTVITVVDGGKTYVSRYVGLSSSGANAAVSRFIAKLSNLRTWLPPGSVGPDQAYVPTSVAVTVQPYQPGKGPSQTPIAWPLGEPLGGSGMPGTTASAGGSCDIVSGNDLAKLMPLISRANQLTPWRYSGRSYALGFRPLLPDQNSC